MTETVVIVAYSFSFLRDKNWLIWGDSQAGEEECDEKSVNSEPFLFPVPAQNQIKIANLYSSGSYDIHDETGKRILAGEYRLGGTIDLEVLRGGFYFLMIDFDERRQVFKFIRVE